MTIADQLQVQVYEDYMNKQRICENCKLPLSDHMQADEGYTRPSLVGSCLNFTDATSREAAKLLTQPKGKAPMGYVH